MPWTNEQLEQNLDRQGYVVDLGQISAAQRRQLDKRAKQGGIFKRRGFWTDPLNLAGFGIGPPKTIFVRNDVAEAAGLKAL